jgi:ubiquinone biosynthesis protein
MILNKDEKKTVDALLKVSNFTADPDRSELERKVAGLFDEFLYLTLKEVDIGKLLQRVLEILAKQGISLKPDLFLMLKALVTVEGLGRSLDPDFQIVEYAEPFIREIQASRYTPKRIATDLLNSGTEFSQLLREIPGQLREVIKKAKEGKLGIEIEHRGLDRAIFELKEISDRIVSAIILASLVIGSSIVTLSNLPPKWRGIPLIGVAGFLVAAVMGFWLLASILRRGKRDEDD